MNKQEFVESVRKSEFCPPDFEEKYERFSHYQELVIDTLLEFHRVCEANEIHYTLSDGALLGAVRNGGQIPWDYDIDVLVPLEERDRLVDALRRDMKEEFYFYSPESDAKCRHYIMRVSPKGYRSEELHVDVFYYIGAPDSEEERQEIAARLIQLIDHRFTKLVNAREASYGKLRKYLGLMRRKLLIPRISLKEEYDEYSSLATRFPLKDSRYALRADQFGWVTWGVATNLGHFMEYYAEDFRNTTLLRTREGEFRIPVGYDRILRETYGDYMTEPSLRSCLDEMLESLNKLDRGQSY